MTMELNKNGDPYYVIGTKYSYNTLKSMTKDRLIELLYIAQHNYECVSESSYNVRQYAKKLDKALDKACYELERADETLKDLRTKVNDIYFGTNTKTEWRNQLIGDSAIETE